MYGIELLQILVACMCGVAIGFERQLHGSQAGVRTYSLVCIGSCLFGIVSTHAHGDVSYYTSVADPTRIAAQVVSGIGFLGAGIIFKDSSRIRGVTTAANVWLVASVGLAIAYRMFMIPIFTTCLVIFILSLNHMKFFIHLKVLLSLHERKFFRHLKDHLAHKHEENVGKIEDEHN